MAIEIQEGIPKEIVKGDAVSFEVTDDKFPAGTWTSKVIFKDVSGSKKPFPGTPSGAKHLFTLSNSDTGTLVPGPNLVCLQFDDGTHRQSNDWSEVEILPDPAAPEPLTYTQTQVSLIQTALAKLISNQFQSVNFNGQSFTQKDHKDLQGQLTYWEARVIQEQKQNAAKHGVLNQRRIAPSFVGPNDSIPPFIVVPK